MADFTKGPASTTAVGEPQSRNQLCAGQSDTIQVEVVGGPMDGTRGRVTNDNFVIDRGNANDLCLPLDQMVSMQHSCISREGQHFWLEDLNSSNGTYFGDVRIDSRTLIGPGTIFIVGKTTLEFMPA